MLYTQTDQEIASERLDTAVTYRIALGGGTVSLTMLTNAPTNAAWLW